jgi:hypothetical protein
MRRCVWVVLVTLVPLSFASKPLAAPVPPQDILDFSQPSDSYTLSPGYAAA